MENLVKEKDTQESKDGNDTDSALADSMTEEELTEARNKLKALIEVAQGEASLSQDLISLLISGLNPDAGVKTMSDYLKSNIPTGSLNVDNARTVNTEYDPFITAGWKAESLENITKSLRTAASSLEAESIKEVKYWKDVSSLSAQREVLFKSRKGDIRDLGIKYGFEDAGSRYNVKGVAILHRLNDGTISFQPGMSRRTQFVRATLYNLLNGEKTKVGCSSSRGVGIVKDTNGNIEAEIQNARNFLFEEELFHEMLHEARNLASHRVQVTDNKIVINLYDEVLELESIDYDAATNEKRTQFSTRANFFCSVFRILLCNLHRRNVERRRQFPSSFTTTEQPKPNVAYILRPLLAHVLHEKILKRTRKALELLIQGTLGDVYPVSITQETIESHSFTSNSKVPSVLSTNPSKRPISGVSIGSTEYLGRLAVQPASNITISIPEKVVVIIKIGSPLQWQSPLYSASSYDWPFDDQKQPKSSSSFHDLSDLEEWIKWIVG